MRNGFRSGPVTVVASAVVPGFSETKRQVLVLNHVLYLSLHCDAEKSDEVHDEDGPKHGDVEHLEEGEADGYHRRLGHAVPELELRQPSHERTELFIGFCRQACAVI